MARDTTAAERTASFEQAFEEAPRAQLPAEVQQIVIDERPRGAISVNVKRDELEVLRKIKIIATAAGDDFFYSWLTKNKDGTKGVVEGPSVKCANAVSRIFGNCSVKVRVFDQGAHWIFYAQFYDMETGYVLERPFQQRKNQKTGMGDADRQMDIVFQIGTSKAARNVVCNALSEFTDYAFAVAKEQLVEKIGKNLAKYRDQVIARLVDLKVDLKRVEASRGKMAATWLAPDVAKVIAEIQAINDGMAHPDELWPQVGAEAGAQKPQPQDFTPAGSEGSKPAAPAQAAASQPQTGKPAAPETAKPEPQPAAAAEALGGAGDQGAVKGAVGTDIPAESLEKPAGEQGTTESDVAGANSDAELLTAQALEYGEAVLQRGIDNLVNLSTAEDVDKAAPSILEVLKEIENLDPEDMAVLSNRWKTATLERKRDLGRKKGGRR